MITVLDRVRTRLIARLDAITEDEALMAPSEIAHLARALDDVDHVIMRNEHRNPASAPTEAASPADDPSSAASSSPCVDDETAAEPSVGDPNTESLSPAAPAGPDCPPSPAGDGLSGESEREVQDVAPWPCLADGCARSFQTYERRTEHMYYDHGLRPGGEPHPNPPAHLRTEPAE